MFAQKEPAMTRNRLQQFQVAGYQFQSINSTDTTHTPVLHDCFTKNKYIMANIRNFANQIQRAYTTQDEASFSRLITIDISSPTVNTLAQDLQHVR